MTRLLCFVTALIAASCSRDFDGANDSPSTGETGSGGEGGAASGPPLALTNELIDQSMEAMCMQAAMVRCPEPGAAGQAGEGGAPSVPVPATASSSLGERERAVRDQCLYFWSLVATGRTEKCGTMLVEYFDCLTRAEPADYFCSGGIPRSTDACNDLHNRWVTCAGFAEPG